MNFKIISSEILNEQAQPYTIKLKIKFQPKCWENIEQTFNTNYVCTIKECDQTHQRVQPKILSDEIIMM